MHESSMARMRSFIDRYLADRRGRPTSILDLGSMDANGSYRPLFDDPAWTYTGVDMDAGPGVDVVLPDPFSWSAFRARSFDVVVSGQVFEHVEFPWVSMFEIARVLRVGGLACIIAPSSGPQHLHPWDCWRFYPDGMVSLAAWADLDMIEAVTAPDEDEWSDDSNLWRDTVLIARRPEAPLHRELFGRVKRVLLRSVCRAHAKRRAFRWRQARDIMRSANTARRST